MIKPIFVLLTGVVGVGGAIATLPQTNAIASQSFGTAIAQANTEDPGELTSEQLAVLRRSELPIALPTYLPEFTEVDQVDAMAPQHNSPDNGADYIVYYRQPMLTGGDSACFELQAASGGFGGPVLPQAINASLPPFAQSIQGYTHQVFWTETGEAEGPFTEPALFSDWIQGEDGVYYRITSNPGRYCSLLSPEEANLILESLRYVD